jgi:hypothetical protein
MLAYVFWHWPADADGYEAGLIEFHAQLRRARVPGCVANASYRTSGPPWLPEGHGYEDWYLLEGFGDLEALNTAAVSPVLRAAHDRPARAAAAGVGGLYAVQRGAIELDAPVLSWLAKPRGMSYADFYAGLPAGPALLRRQFVLGPGFEFCAMDEWPEAVHARRERLF